jgi:hypothetical protein
MIRHMRFSSLEIGRKVIHYFVAGTVLLLSGLINLVLRRRHRTIKIRARALGIYERGTCDYFLFFVYFFGSSVLDP